MRGAARWSVHCAAVVLLVSCRFVPASTDGGLDSMEEISADLVAVLPRLPANTAHDDACPVHLKGRHTNAQLLLRSSHTRRVVTTAHDATIINVISLGRYSVVPPEAYGLKPNSQLEVNCVTLQVVGVRPSVPDSAQHIWGS